MQPRLVARETVISSPLSLATLLGRLVLKTTFLSDRHVFFLPGSQATLHAAVRLMFLKPHSHCAVQNTFVVLCSAVEPDPVAQAHSSPPLPRGFSPACLLTGLPAYCDSVTTDTLGFLPAKPSRSCSKSPLSKPVLSFTRPDLTHLPLFFRQTAV